ncbi:MAG: hypothetical protein AAGL18_07915, partial [Pseudomonadota bacterium]
LNSCFSRVVSSVLSGFAFFTSAPGPLVQLMMVDPQMDEARNSWFVPAQAAITEAMNGGV